MRKFQLTLAFLLLMFPALLSAQQGSGAGRYAQIKGKVTLESAQGEPVGFATGICCHRMCTPPQKWTVHMP